MPKTRDQKQNITKNLTDKLQKSQITIFIDYKGLKVKEFEEIRNECRKDNSECLVAKKTLIKIACDENKMQGVNPKDLSGNLALVVGYGDEVTPAKILKGFVKKYKLMKILGGVMNGQYVDDTVINNLASIPSKPELYAKLVGSLNSPLSGLVNVLQGNLRQLVYVLQAIKETKS